MSAAAMGGAAMGGPTYVLRPAPVVWNSAVARPLAGTAGNPMLAHHMGAGPAAATKAMQQEKLAVSRTIVVAWNLGYTKQTIEKLLNDLEYYDFKPEHLIACPDGGGAFVMWYNEEWLANAAIVSFDGTTEYLAHNGEAVRLCKYMQDQDHRNVSEEIPSDLRYILTRFKTQLLLMRRVKTRSESGEQIDAGRDYSHRTDSPLKVRFVCV